MSGETAQSNVTARVSVGVLWYFDGFHRNLLTWDPVITVSRTGSSLSLSGSLHLQLIPTDSKFEPWLSGAISPTLSLLGPSTLQGDFGGKVLIKMAPGPVSPCDSQ